MVHLGNRLACGADSHSDEVVCLAVSCIFSEKTSLGSLVKSQPEENSPRDQGFFDRGSNGASSCGSKGDTSVHVIENLDWWKG